MEDYSSGKIYKLHITDIPDICYIGSTRDSLETRFAHHRHQASNEKQNKCAAASLFQEGDVIISLIEDYPCQSKRALEERERYWIEQHPDCVNKNIPTRGWRERWYAKHEHNLAKHRDWLEAHKEELAEQRKQKRQADLESARAKDKESNAQRDKEKRKAWKNAKVKCDKCNLILSRNNFTIHKKNLHEGEASYGLLE